MPSDSSGSAEVPGSDSGPAQKPATTLLELCAGGIDDVALAQRLQVDRIELNCGMAVGGLTPTSALTAAARKCFGGPIIAMLRPREGGFAYSDLEYQQMLGDAEQLLAMGVDGIAVGFLLDSGELDLLRCQQLRSLLPKATLVCHRAFDVVPDQLQALHQLMDCGFDRILTSGGAATAEQGAIRLRQLIQIADGRIEILPGGGVRAANAMKIVLETGCTQIHSAVRAVAFDTSAQAATEVHYGLPGEANGSYGRTSESQLEALLKVVRSASSGPI